MKVVSTMFKAIAGVIVGTVLAFVPVATTHAAPSASVSASPSSGTYAKGSTFAVTIYENSGDDDVDSARADLTYDANKLEAIGISAGDFTTCVTAPSAGAGTISTGDCTILGAKKRGQQRLATVTFKAVAEGTAPLNFTGAKVVNNGTDLAVTTSNASFTVTAPASAGQGGGSTGGSAGSASNNTTATNSVAQRAGNTGSTAPVAQTTPTQEEVQKTEGATDKKDNKQAQPENNDEAKGQRSAWPWIILLLIAATAAIYVYRKRGNEVPAEEKNGGEATPKNEKLAPATEEAIAPAVTKAKKPSHKKTNKHSSNKRNR
jgi:hypothetical protein